MKSSKPWRGYGIAAAVFAVGACADNVTAPKSVISSLGPRHQTQAVVDGFLISNSKKYREQTLPYQSNRSGVASLTSRALLGRDGNTVLEVTTGELDESGAPGNISKLQEKLLDGNKALFATQNFNGLTGPVQTRTFPGLARHGFIQTQGNVRDIDPTRTDVMTVTERVNLRPDLAVTAVTAPDRGRPNVDFIVVADVHELNGDVGAYDDCVLYVDGSEAARINHQWVADRDLVNCSFRTSITTVGMHTLEVRSQNVIPGDWDLANNSASRTIEIVNPEVRLSGFMFAQEEQAQAQYHADWSYSGLPGGYAYSGVYDNTFDYHTNLAYFYAWAYDQPGTGPLTSINFSLTSGGSPVVAFSATPINSGNCSYLYADYGYSWVYVCSWDNHSYASGGRYAGQVVYYNYYFFQDNTGYTYSYGPVSGSATWGGSAITFGGNDVTLNFRAEGATGTALVANAILTLDLRRNDFDRPLACYDDNYPGYYTAHICYEQHYHGLQRSGFTPF
jgi:hypothetical protein